MFLQILATEARFVGIIRSGAFSSRSKSSSGYSRLPYMMACGEDPLPGNLFLFHAFVIPILAGLILGISNIVGLISIINFFIIEIYIGFMITLSYYTISILRISLFYRKHLKIIANAGSVKYLISSFIMMIFSASVIYFSFYTMFVHKVSLEKSNMLMLKSTGSISFVIFMFYNSVFCVLYLIASFYRGSLTVCDLIHNKHLHFRKSGSVGNVIR